jgi:hypothetical protein
LAVGVYWSEQTEGVGGKEGKIGYPEVSDVQEPGWPSGVFLREQMSGFHVLLRQNPISLFMLFGWSSISMASMMMHPGNGS